MHPFSYCARCTAIAAPIVDFPHCLVQFRIPRFAPQYLDLPLVGLKLKPFSDVDECGLFKLLDLVVG